MNVRAQSLPVGNGYFRQYLDRMEPPPPPPAPLPLPARSQVLPGMPTPRTQRKATSNVTSVSAARSIAPKKKHGTSLVDAFRKHGMRLCDGSKLNAVGKALTVIGVIPSTLGGHVTSVYMSQNDLRSLDGVQQFKSVRLLSLGGNLLSRFSEIMQLAMLTKLRHLNLLGNPICAHPNYRFRTIAALEQIETLDTVQISKRERQLAPQIASQDKVLRATLIRNHIDVQKLQCVVSWIQVLEEFHGLVLSDARTGRFDQLRDPRDSYLNVDRFLLLWQYEEVLSLRQREDLEIQMTAIVVRAHAQLADHPREKAKDLLLRLAKIPNDSAHTLRRLSHLSSELQDQCIAWENAYASVLNMQQQSLVKLRAQCERASKAMLESLRDLLVTDPSQRRWHLKKHQKSIPDPSNYSSTGYHSHAEYDKPSSNEIKNPLQLNTTPSNPTTNCPLLRQPGNHKERMASNEHDELLNGGFSDENDSVHGNLGYRCIQRQQHARRTGVTSKSASHRSGQFGNKSLREAVDGFTLRDHSIVTKLPRARKAVSPRTDRAASPRSRKATSPLSLQSTSTAVQPVRSASCDLVGSIDVPSTLNFTRGHILQKCTAPYPRTSDSCTTAASACGEDCSDAGSAPVSDTNVSFDTATTASRHADPSTVGGTHCLPSSHAVVSLAQARRSFRDETSSIDFAGTNLHLETDRSPLATTQQWSGIQADMEGEEMLLKARQQELEEREEKYIKALMASEQREVDLRHQMNALRKQVTQYRQHLSESIQQRREIKREMEDRVSAIANPKIMHRYFLYWKQHHQQSLQLRHIQRKCCFLLTHDRFWCWRRNAWILLQQRSFQAKRLTRIARVHFTEWANFTRISIIGRNTNALRSAQLGKRILNGWYHQCRLLQITRRLTHAKTKGKQQSFVRRCFHAWRRGVKHHQQIIQLQQYQLKTTLRSEKLTTFRQWRIFILSVARPAKVRADILQIRTAQCCCKLHFTAWKVIVKSLRLYRVKINRLVWESWVQRTKRDQQQRQLLEMARRDILTAHSRAWHSLASQHAKRRRSLLLATRFVDHRRVRKVWMHWKIYSITRKRYVQGSMKALRYYFIKLLRNSWRSWTVTTRCNRLASKEKKHHELRKHFQTFRSAVMNHVADRLRQRFVQHTRNRHARCMLRRHIKAWIQTVQYRRRCKWYESTVHTQRSRKLLLQAWTRWKSRYIARLQRRIVKWRTKCGDAVIEKQNVEDELILLNDRSISLAEQLGSLTKQIGVQEKGVLTHQHQLTQREKEIARLEEQLAQAQDAQLRQEKMNDVKVQRSEENLARLLAQNECLANENRSLQTQVKEMTHTSATALRKLHLADAEIHELTSRLNQSHQSTKDQSKQHFELTKSMENTIAELNRCLQNEKKEREDIANRLQEYETNIARTCEEMTRHESDHEQERKQLRAEYKHMETLWKESSVRNAELQHLLHEKNDKIIELTLQITTCEDNSRSERELACPDEQISSKEDQIAIGSQAIPPVSSRFGFDASKSHVVSSLPVGSLIVNEESLNALATGVSANILTRSQHEKSRGDLHTTPTATCPSQSLGANALLVENTLTSSADRKTSRQCLTNSQSCTEDQLIDDRANKVHEDIRLLQERIIHRLEQVPCAPAMKSINHRGRSIKCCVDDCKFKSKCDEEMNAGEWRSTSPTCGVASASTNDQPSIILSSESKSICKSTRQLSSLSRAHVDTKNMHPLKMSRALDRRKHLSHSPAIGARHVPKQTQLRKKKSTLVSRKERE